MDNLSMHISAYFRSQYTVLLLSIFLGVTCFSYSNSVNAQEESKKTEDKQSEAEKKTPEAGESSKKKMNRAESIKAPNDLYEQQQSDLKHFINKVEPLLVGTEELTTLYSSSNTSNNKGVIILLPDWQQSAVSPKNMAFLHNTMPNKGWATLTIQPLSRPENYPSNALEAKVRNEENAETIKKYNKELTEIYQVIMKKVASMPGIFIFVTEGNNASYIADIVNQEDVDKPNAIVFLSAFKENDIENKNFADSLAMTEIPVLDLFLSKDNRHVHPSAALRKKQAEKELKVMYRQKMIHNFTPNYYPKTTLAKEIQGWLASIGW